MTAALYQYHSNGRRRSTAIIVLTIWMVLGAAVVWLQASLLVLAILAAFTLPALYDLIANPHSTFTLDATHLRWTTPRQQADIALSEIDHLRFDTRLDMSVRLTVVRPSGVKIRVPYPATPPHATFELMACHAGLKTERHHFSLLG
jgi:hypothetical protein